MTLQEMTITDLTTTAISDITQKTLDSRYEIGNNEINVVAVNFYMKKDFLEIIFACESTYGAEDFIAAVDIPNIPNGSYAVVLRFYGISEYIDKNISMLPFSTLSVQIKNVLHNCDVKLYADDSSFYYQAWEGLDKNKLAIYKFPGEPGKGIWDTRHFNSGGLINKKIHITKHIAQIIQNIDDFVNQICIKGNVIN